MKTKTLTLKQLGRKVEEGRVEVMEDIEDFLLDENVVETAVEIRDIEKGTREVIRLVDKI